MYEFALTWKDVKYVTQLGQHGIQIMIVWNPSCNHNWSFNSIIHLLLTYFDTALTARFLLSVEILSQLSSISRSIFDLCQAVFYFNKVKMVSLKNDPLLTTPPKSMIRKADSTNANMFFVLFQIVLISSCPTFFPSNNFVFTTVSHISLALDWSHACTCY